MFMNKKKRALTVFDRLNRIYPNVGTFLVHKNPFELLIAVILSAQCTDERVNKTTPALFKQFPTPKALDAAPLDDVRNAIKSIMGNHFSTSIGLESYPPICIITVSIFVFLNIWRC